MKRIHLLLRLAAMSGLAAILACCVGTRPAQIPSGYVVWVGHVNNILGSSLTVYGDGSAVYREMGGRVTWFRLSVSQARRLNEAMDDPDLVPQLRVLTVKSSRVDAEEWEIAFRGESFNIDCQQTMPPPAVLELIEAAQSAARGHTREEWFFSLHRCFVARK